jgi:hypothetical protein
MAATFTQQGPPSTSLADYIQFVSNALRPGGNPAFASGSPWPDDGLGFVRDGANGFGLIRDNTPPPFSINVTGPGSSYDVSFTGTSGNGSSGGDSPGGSAFDRLTPVDWGATSTATTTVPQNSDQLGAPAWLNLVAANAATAPTAETSASTQPPTQIVGTTRFRSNPYTPVGLSADLAAPPAVGLTYDSADSANDDSGLLQTSPDPWQRTRDARDAQPGDALLARYAPEIQTPLQAAQLVRAMNDVNTPALPTPGTVGQAVYAMTAPPKPLGDLLDVWHQIQQNNADTTQAMRDMAIRAGKDPDAYAPLAPVWERIGQGAGNAAVDFAAGFTSPLGLTTLGMGALPRALQKAAGIGFTAPMLWQLPGQIQQIKEEENKPDGQIDWQKLGGLYFNTVANAGLGALTVAHGLSPSQPLAGFSRPTVTPVRTETASTQYPLGTGDLLSGARPVPTPGGVAANPTIVVTPKAATSPPVSTEPTAAPAKNISTTQASGTPGPVVWNGRLVDASSPVGGADAGSYPLGTGDLLRGGQPMPPPDDVRARVPAGGSSTPPVVGEVRPADIPALSADTGNKAAELAASKTLDASPARTPTETAIPENQNRPQPNLPTGGDTIPTSAGDADGRPPSGLSQPNPAVTRTLPPDVAATGPRSTIDPDPVPGPQAGGRQLNLGPQAAGWRAGAEQAALKLEGLKSGISGSGQLHAFGIAPYLWDGAVGVAQGVIRAGGSTADAIDAAINHVRNNYQGKFNETGARGLLAQTLSSVGRSAATGIRSGSWNIATGRPVIRSIGNAAGNKQISQPRQATNVDTAGGSASAVVPGASALLRPYGGTGGGHHGLIKKAFEGAENYDLNAALAIPNDELARLGLRHRVITGKQRSLYRAFAKKNKQLTLDDVMEIEEQVLVSAGMDPAMAKNTVQKAVEHLRASKVSGPTRIPWKNK